MASISTLNTMTPQHLCLVEDGRGKIVAALQRSRAEREEASALAFHGLLEIGAVGEVLADETQRRVVIAGRNSVSVREHHIDVG